GERTPGRVAGDGGVAQIQEVRARKGNSGIPARIPDCRCGIQSSIIETRTQKADNANTDRTIEPTNRRPTPAEAPVLCGLGKRRTDSGRPAPVLRPVLRA